MKTNFPYLRLLGAFVGVTSLVVLLPVDASAHEPKQWSYPPRPQEPGFVRANPNAQIVVRRNGTESVTSENPYGRPSKEAYRAGRGGPLLQSRTYTYGIDTHGSVQNGTHLFSEWETPPSQPLKYTSHHQYTATDVTGRNEAVNRSMTETFRPASKNATLNLAADLAPFARLFKAAGIEKLEGVKQVSYTSSKRRPNSLTLQLANGKGRTFLFDRQGNVSEKGDGPKRPIIPLPKPLPPLYF